MLRRWAWSQHQGSPTSRLMTWSLTVQSCYKKWTLGVVVSKKSETHPHWPLLKSAIRQATEENVFCSWSKAVRDIKVSFSLILGLGVAVSAHSFVQMSERLANGLLLRLAMRSLKLILSKGLAKIVLLMLFNYQNLDMSSGKRYVFERSAYSFRKLPWRSSKEMWWWRTRLRKEPIG